MTARRRWLWSEVRDFDNLENLWMDREQLIAQHIERFIAVHKKWTGKFIPTPHDLVVMSNAARNSGALSLHFGAFCPTLLSQCTEEQKAEWLWRAFTMQIIGCLAQTEIGPSEHSLRFPLASFLFR